MPFTVVCPVWRRGLCPWLFHCFSQLSKINVEMLDPYFSKEAPVLLEEKQKGEGDRVLAVSRSVPA